MKRWRVTETHTHGTRPRHTHVSTWTTKAEAIEIFDALVDFYTAQWPTIDSVRLRVTDTERGRVIRNRVFQPDRRGAV